jgi:hypothetical protein
MRLTVHSTWTNDPRSRSWRGILARVVLLVLAGAVLGSCHATESREAGEARGRRALYQKQIAGLEEVLARGRREGLSRDRIFVGVSEEVFREVVAATLPQEVVVKDAVRLRLEKAEAYFRYTQGVVLFDGTLASVDRPSLFIAVRLAGGIDRVQYDQGRLSAHVQIYYFEVRGAALGDMGKGVVEALVRNHLDLVSNVVPPVEIPVRLEQGIAVKGLSEGPVSAGPGTLPFSASVARVVSVDGRLWISLDVAAGPWRNAAETAPAEPTPAEPAAAGAQ